MLDRSNPEEKNPDTTPDTNTPAGMARALIERGWSPVPIHVGQKRPVGRPGKNMGWLILGFADLHRIVKIMGEYGVGVVCGLPDQNLIGIDIDRDDIVDAVKRVLPETLVRKRGAKGETLFFRGPDIVTEALNRLLEDGKTRERIVDILGPGRQTVLPPTQHPTPNTFYRWTGDARLDEFDPADLPLLSPADIEAMKEALRPFGYMPDADMPPTGDRPAKAMRRPGEGYSGSGARAGGVTPFRRLNNAALDNLSAWVPHLPLYKLESKPGGYHAVADWRSSSTGRPLEQRDRNLSIFPTGIRDFGTNEGFTPIDLVMAAGRCDFGPAFCWLSDVLDPAPADIELTGPAPRESATFEQDGETFDRETGEFMGGNDREQDSAPEAAQGPKADAGAQGAKPGSKQPPTAFKKLDAFLAEYEPFDYVLDGIIRTACLYSLTAPTGAGKTGFLTLLALAVATGSPFTMGMPVIKGRVAYLAIENADDVRMRMMATVHFMRLDPAVIAERVLILDANKSPEDIRKDLANHAAVEPFALVVGDTFIAMFDGDNPNDPVQTRGFMARFRPLTKLPGRPAVVIACHPVKNPQEDQLTPYGSGAIVNEVDGNLTLWKATQDAMETKLHWQTKLRGVAFEPVAFRFETVSCPKIVDAKGTILEVPVMTPTTINAADFSRVEANDARELILLRLIRDEGMRTTQKQLAAKMGLSESAVSRRLQALKAQKLAKKQTGFWTLTPMGNRHLEHIDLYGVAPTENESENDA